MQIPVVKVNDLTWKTCVMHSRVKGSNPSGRNCFSSDTSVKVDLHNNNNLTAESSIWLEAADQTDRWWLQEQSEDEQNITVRNCWCSHDGWRRWHEVWLRHQLEKDVLVPCDQHLPPDCDTSHHLRDHPILWWKEPTGLTQCLLPMKLSIL